MKSNNYGNKKLYQLSDGTYCTVQDVVDKTGLKYVGAMPGLEDLIGQRMYLHQEKNKVCQQDLNKWMPKSNGLVSLMWLLQAFN